MADDWPVDNQTEGYQANVTLALNAKPGVLYPLAGSTGNYSQSAEQIEDRFDDLYMVDKTERNGDTNNTDMSSVRRWVKKPVSANTAPTRDRDDKMSTRVDIDSPMVLQTRRAAARYHDEKFIEGYFGDAWTGRTGDTAVPFKSANTIDHDLGGTSVGLTEDKLMALSEMYELLDVDTEEEMPIVLVTPKQVTDLLNIERYVNSDYTGERKLDRRELKPYNNLRFFPVNLGSPKAFPRTSSLTLSGSVRSLPTFVPSGMHMAIWTLFWGKIEELASKNYSTQVYGESCSTATRLDEDKCIILECKE